MPSLPELFEELNRLQAAGDQALIEKFFVETRAKAFAVIAQHHQAAVIQYASMFPAPPHVHPSLTMVEPSDVHRFMGMMKDVDQKKLVLILHSPGGSVEAAEGLGTYLRSKFTDRITVVIPHLAMSAATILSCVADEILMGPHSFLGPIDPQISTGSGSIPVQSIVDDFNLAKKECKEDPANVMVWGPKLQAMPPGMISLAENAATLSKQVVKAWLEKWMFSGLEPTEAEARANGLSEWLGNHNKHLSHNRHLSNEELRAHQLPVGDMQADKVVYDAYMTLHHTAKLLFDRYAVVKIVENHLGRRAVERVMMQAMGPMLPQAFFQPVG